MNNNYTKSSLRERIKQRIKNSNVGGTAAGKWSARKSQILVKRYEDAGGSYKGRKNKTQRSLVKWGSERWQYSSNKSKGKGRYLPEKVWKSMSTSDRKLANQSKYKSKKQYASYPNKINNLMKSNHIY